MPEAPELELVKDFLNERVAGRRVTAVSVVKPSVLRSLCGDLATDAVGRTIERATRRGKFMLLDLSGQRVLAVNPMLTGAFQVSPPSLERQNSPCAVRLASTEYLGASGSLQIPARPIVPPDSFTRELPVTRSPLASRESNGSDHVIPPSPEVLKGPPLV